MTKNSTRQELLQALAEAGEARPPGHLLWIILEACDLTPGSRTASAMWDLTDEQLLEGLKKLME